jgi:hypothetical protein
MNKIVLMSSPILGDNAGFGRYQVKFPDVYPAGYARTDPDAHWDNFGDALDHYKSESRAAGYPLEEIDQNSLEIVDAPVGVEDFTVLKCEISKDQTNYYAVWAIPAPEGGEL